MPHVHNALHHATSLQDAFRKAVGEQDPGFTGIERAGETLTPTINLWERPEWARLRGETLWSLRHAQAAVAAEMGFVGLRNPATSRSIAVIQNIRVDVGAAARVNVTHGLISATDVDGSEDLAPRDTRFTLTGVGPLFKIHGAGIAQQGNDAFETVVGTVAFAPEELWGGRVITPGFELRIYCGTVNIALDVSMRGYVRLALAGELA